LPTLGAKSFPADWLIYYIQTSLFVKEFARPISQIHDCGFFTTLEEIAPAWWPVKRMAWTA
jgi:hypothetical protein